MEKLLLHSCCGPCSSSVLERLVPEYDVTLVYYNPNIYPMQEYEKRKAEQIRLLSQVYPQVKYLDCDYDYLKFLECVKGFECQKEGGSRCEKCFSLRLDYVAKKCAELGFDRFGTTLSVSPYKNAKLLNEIGIALAEKYAVGYLVADFKKQNGYLRSIELSKKYELYRQHYCGCEFSLKQALEMQERKKEQNKY